MEWIDSHSRLQIDASMPGRSTEKRTTEAGSRRADGPDIAFAGGRIPFLGSLPYEQPG